MSQTQQAMEGYVSSYNQATGFGYIRPRNSNDDRFFVFDKSVFGENAFRAHFTVSVSGEEGRGSSSDVRFCFQGNRCTTVEEVLRY